MSETKFTPGPWHWVDVGSRICIENKSGDDIASVLNYAEPEIEIADAHLIAAAPELYEALIDMFNGWQYIRQSHGDLYGVGWDRAEDKARAALAKARGEQ